MSVLRTVITPGAIVRVALGWGSVIALAAGAPTIASAPLPLTVLFLALVVAVILIAAFGVVYQAEALAHRLGDPYGSLVLTLSIVLIEVILIASVLLGPGEHTTIARDSVLAVIMIILGLVVGLSLLIGARRDSRVRRAGTISYIVMIIVLTGIAFGVPSLLSEGTYSGAPALVIAGVTVGGYGLFLARQMGPRADDYREFIADTEQPDDVRTVVRTHGAELALRTIMLTVTVIPIVLMSHDMSTLMDTAFTAVGAPIALSGVVIAAIVFTPETITTLRAARSNEFQRVVNLCLGAVVSTVGLTIPVVLVIGELTNRSITLAPAPELLALLGGLIAAMIFAFRGARPTRSRGILPLLIFTAFFVLLAL